MHTDERQTRIVHIIESDLIRLRTREGMKVAKAKGRLRGKQPKLNRKQEAHLVSLVHSGEYSTAEVAELFVSAAPPSTEPSNANASRPRRTSQTRHQGADRSRRQPSRIRHPTGTTGAPPALPRRPPPRAVPLTDIHEVGSTSISIARTRTLRGRHPRFAKK